MKIYHNYNLKNLNTLRIESSAKLYVEIDSINEIIAILTILKYIKYPYSIIGNGSKILFKNEITNTLIIKLTKNFSVYIYNEKYIYLSSNILLRKVILDFAKKDIDFYSKLFPIPASIGGAIYMNAGIKNYNISDNIKYIIYLNNRNKLKAIKKENAEFKYRNSIFKKKKLIIIGALFSTIKSDSKTILSNINEEITKRKKSQEISAFTCGSTFKNHKKYKAYYLINMYFKSKNKYEDIHVSDKHSNFIVNDENGKGNDVYSLINDIKNDVYKGSKIKLKEEIIYIE